MRPLALAGGAPGFGQAGQPSTTTTAAEIRAYDPEAGVTARRLFNSRISLCEKSYDECHAHRSKCIVPLKFERLNSAARSRSPRRSCDRA